MATAKPKNASGPGGAGSIESQLREEIAQLTTALEETDQALDEWVAECERLQGIIKAKEGDMKTLAEQMDELRLHSLKLEEECNRIKSEANGRAPSSSPVSVAASSKAVEDLKRANDLLREQLAQSQNWVKEGLAKVEAANAAAEVEKKRAAQIEKEQEELMKGKKTALMQERDKAVGEAARLSAVVHAHELEIASLRAKLATAKDDLKDASALAGKTQALCTVARFQAETANTDNDMVVNWVKSAVRWSSRL